MTNLQFDILPQRSAVLAGHSTEIHALVRARGPELPIGRALGRKPLNLSLVIDRSGSMSGAPLEEAKRCASYILGNLQATDRASLVVYDDTVDVLVPSTLVTDMSVFERALEQVNSRGMTDLFKGWDTGAKQCLEAHSGEYLSRVLLLSDGGANQGLTDEGAISDYCAGMANAGVSTSTYGLGHDFNEDLMVTMAKAGEGQSYYGETVEDLMDPFQEEFSLLSSLCARELCLRLSAPEGVKLELLNDYKKLEAGMWRMPDVAYGGEVWALVKLTVPATLPVRESNGTVEFMSASLGFSDARSGEPDTHTCSLRLPQFPLHAWQSLVEEERVVARLQEVRVAQIQRAIREAALRHDWRSVERLIEDAEIEAGNNAWLTASLESIKKYARRRDSVLMSKEASYSSKRMLSRTAALDEDATQYDIVQETVKPMFLRKKQEQGKRMDR